MKIWITCILLTISTLHCFAQNETNHSAHQHGEEEDDKSDGDDDMDHMDFRKLDKPRVRMSSSYSLYLPMTRNGSGTAWLPDATYVFGAMIHARNWVFMASGDVFARYNKQDIFNAGGRGGEQTDAPNMIMFMGQRKVGAYGLFHFSTMFSADAASMGGSGYPLLFQTGESWQGKPLVDRQHPHDLFSELSVGYTQALSPKADVYIYAGYPGEPALGPTVFMHRPSGMFDPNAPIGHHWSDATHITFGVGTLGFRYGKFKIEGSSFTGREPDEQRYDLDQLRFDSRSARLSFNPTYHWALQVSQGFIKSPEALHPNEDIVRTTASATCVYSLGKLSYFSATGLWGQNKIKQSGDMSNAALLEATLKLRKKAIYGRYEWVQKSAEELALNPIQYAPDKLFAINALTIGASYELFTAWYITTAVGAQVTGYYTPADLTSLYGSTPVGGQVYLHLYPRMMNTR